jgi:hypothetical protein
MRAVARYLWTSPYKALAALAGLGAGALTEPGHLTHQVTASVAIGLFAAADGTYLWARSRNAKAGEA